MKITIINTDKNTWHSDQLKKEAEKRNFSCQIITSSKIPDISDIGDVLIMRSTLFDSKQVKENFLSSLEKKTFVFNWSDIRKPLVSNKSVQQKILSSIRGINTIETFKIKSKKTLIALINKRILIFPFIQKPDSGSMGKDVNIIKNSVELKKLPKKFEKSIFQNFIPNSGDFRVLILEGKPLGVIKRTAPKGSMLNNISLGGSAKQITDPQILEKVYPIALRAASALGLSYCGVDIIFNQEDGRYYFLESNSAAQWKGFQSATKINVAKEIIDFCEKTVERKNDSIANIIKKTYEDSLPFLWKYRFHFISRMWLWTREKKFRNHLLNVKNDYIGKNSQETRKKIEKILAKKVGAYNIKNKKERKRYFKKYPLILNYEELFSFYFFSKNIFKINLEKIINKYIKKEDLLMLCNQLSKDEQALKSLSTFAINILYLMRDFFKKDQLVNPENFLNIAKKISNEEMRIYFLTHCIIQESAFYQKPIKNSFQTYRAMLALIEKTIRKNLKKISLDAKLEFIVCTKIINYKTTLEKKILAEASKSLSSLGNFLVDTLNNYSKNPLKHNLLVSEHRNVLFLMANSDYNINEKTLKLCKK